MADKEFPTSLTIPVPTEIPYSFGIEATSGPYGCFIQFRGTHKERDKIHRAAAMLGLSYGSFMRRVVNDAADLVLKHYTEEQTTDPTLEGEDGTSTETG